MEDVEAVSLGHVHNAGRAAGPNAPCGSVPGPGFLRRERHRSKGRQEDRPALLEQCLLLFAIGGGVSAQPGTVIGAFEKIDEDVADRLGMSGPQRT